MSSSSIRMANCRVVPIVARSYPPTREAQPPPSGRSVTHLTLYAAPRRRERSSLPSNGNFEGMAARRTDPSAWWRPPRVAADESEDAVLKWSVLGDGYRRGVVPVVDLPLPPTGRQGRQRGPKKVDLLRIHPRVLSRRFGEIPPVLGEIEAEGAVEIV